MKRFGVLIFSLFILFTFCNISFSNAETWRSWWGKSPKQVQKDINDSNQPVKMKIKNEWPVVNLKSYEAKEKESIYFLNNKMVRIFYTMWYSNLEEDDVQQYAYELFNKHFEGYPVKTSTNKHGLTDYTWYLDQDIQFKLISLPKNNKMNWDVTSKEWRYFLKNRDKSLKDSTKQTISQPAPPPIVVSTVPLEWYPGFWYKSVEEVQQIIYDRRFSFSRYPDPPILMFEKEWPEYNVIAYAICQSEQFYFLNNKLVRIIDSADYKKIERRTAEGFLQMLIDEHKGCPCDIEKNRHGLKVYTWHFKNGFVFKFNQTDIEQYVKWEITTKEWRDVDWTGRRN